MASRNRDFRAEYARRKARDAAAGFSSPRARRTQRERTQPTTAFSRAEEYARANIRAKSEGFRNAKERREYLKTPRRNRDKFQRDAILDYFGISLGRFNQIRRENRHWFDEYGMLQHSEINVYNMEIDEAVDDWSERRVGYIISFHAAVVNPRTNYDSLQRTWVRGNKKTGNKGYSQRRTDDHGKIVTNASQYFYLVKYAQLMSVDYFESRYGRAAIVEALRKRVPAP